MYQSLTIIGRLGQEPRTNQVNGNQVTNFSVATDQTWNDANGNRVQRTTWFQVAAWNGLAKPCADYLHKGSQVMVEGTLQDPRPYKNNQGEWVAQLPMRANTVKFLTPATAPSGGGAPPNAATATPIDENEIPF